MVSAGAIGSMKTQQHSRGYNSFSGCDVHATFNGIRIGELQGLSFTITREKAPIYTMASKDPRGFSRGKRGIAGSIVTAVFDRSALLKGLNSSLDGRGGQVILPKDEIIYNAFRKATGPSVTGSLSTAGAAGLLSQDPREGAFEQIESFYVDQLPPFNIVLNAINEYGHSMSMSIHNVEILNIGSGISIDDIMIDESVTWVATNITPWQTKNFIDPTKRI